MVIRTATMVLVLSTLMLASVIPAHARHRHGAGAVLTAAEAPHAGDAGALGQGYSCHWPPRGGRKGGGDSGASSCHCGPHGEGGGGWNGGGGGGGDGDGGDYDSVRGQWDAKDGVFRGT